MQRRQKAFTIVELIVVITIIGILATVGAFSFIALQKDARDTQREAQATIIADALEKYYEKNGEYPGCTQIGVNNDTARSTLGGIDSDVMVAPKASAGTINSVRCQNITLASQDDFFAYIGDQTASCQTATTDPACSAWQLKYKKEANNEIVVFKSRQSSDDFLLALDVDVTATLSGANAVGTVVLAGACQTGATVERQIRHRVNEGAWSAYTTISSSQTIPATEGSTYSFQARARCVAGGSVTSAWQESDVKSVTRPVTAPTTSSLTVTATLSGTNAVGTAGGGGCSAGFTLERQIRYHETATTAAGSWQAWTDGASRTVAANEGHRYTFVQQARCGNGTLYSAWVTSSQADVIRPIAAPSAPVVSVNEAMKTWTWPAVTCTTGTTVGYQYRLRTNAGSTGSWIATTTRTVTNSAATSQGVRYYVDVQARCTTAIAASGWSATGQNSFVIPVVHQRIQQWAIKMESYSNTPSDSRGYAQVKIRTFSGNCASGLARETRFRLSVADVGQPKRWDYAGDGYNVVAVNAPKTLIVDSPADIANSIIAVGSAAEADAYTRCRNTTTNYFTDASSATSLRMQYDIGNLWNKGNRKYNIGCGATFVSGMPAYCSGGYGRDGTNSSLSTNPLHSGRQCRIRADTGISNADVQGFTPFINFDSNPRCWNTHDG